MRLLSLYYLVLFYNTCVIVDLKVPVFHVKQYYYVFYFLCSYHIPTPRNFSFYVVNEDRVYIVERGGEYRKTITRGFHVLKPIKDKVAQVFPLDEQDVVLPPQCVVLKDKIVEPNVVLTLQVRSDFTAKCIILQIEHICDRILSSY